MTSCTEFNNQIKEFHWVISELLKTRQESSCQSTEWKKFPWVRWIPDPGQTANWNVNDHGNGQNKC